MSGPESTPTIVSVDIPTETHTPDIGQEMIRQIDRDRALNDLRKLTGEEPVCDDSDCYMILDRQTGGEGLQWAKKYAISELTKAGYRVEVEAWTRGDYSDQNLIVRKPGSTRPEEEVYFIAHLDGMKKTEGERYPAADDNASGVVDLLELARVLGGQSFDRTVVLFFSTGEEQGSLGAKSYLSRLSPEELNAVKAVINIDMIGYDADQDSVMQLFHGNQLPAKALATAISDTLMEYGLDLTPLVLKGCP